MMQLEHPLSDVLVIPQYNIYNNEMIWYMYRDEMSTT